MNKRKTFSLISVAAILLASVVAGWMFLKPSDTEIIPDTIEETSDTEEIFITQHSY